MKKLLLFFFCCLAANIVSAQNTETVKSIYFETAKHDISPESEAVLNEIMTELAKYETYTLTIQGNTDDKGNNKYNKALSERRANTTKSYFLKNNISENNIEITAFGEEKPIADNTEETGKQRNRRVDIFLRGTLKVVKKAAIVVENEPKITPIKQEEPKEDVNKIMAALGVLPETFSIDPNQDQIIRTKKGTVLYVKAGIFRTNCGRVTLKIKEILDNADIILENVATDMANGEHLESQGMVSVESFDCNGKKIDESPNSAGGIIASLPTDSLQQGFNAYKAIQAADGITKWEDAPESSFSTIKTADLVLCSDYLWRGCGGHSTGESCETCYDLLFCEKTFPISIFLSKEERWVRKYLRLERKIGTYKTRLNECNTFWKKRGKDVSYSMYAYAQISKKEIEPTKEKLYKAEKELAAIAQILVKNKIKTDGFNYNTDVTKRIAGGENIMSRRTALNAKLEKIEEDRCKALEQTYSKYGVTNYRDLEIALNKTLLDRFGVKTMVALRDTLDKIKKRVFEQAFDDGKVENGEVDAYLSRYLNMNVNSNGYNIMQIRANKIYNFDKPLLQQIALTVKSVSVQNKDLVLTSVKTRENTGKDLNIRLVLKKRRATLSADSENEKVVFNKLPVGFDTWIVAIKIKDGKPLLAITETTTALLPKTIDELAYQSVTIDELRTKLQQINYR